MNRVLLDVEQLRYYYDKLSEFDVLFNDFIGNNIDDFIKKFITQNPDGSLESTGLIWQVDDVGIIYLTSIRPGIEAEGHFSFWDQRLKGREPLIRAMLKKAFEDYKFHRIVAHIPLYAKPVLAFVERVGFIKEGRMREAVRYKGDWMDANLYSILDREVEDVGTD